MVSKRVKRAVLPMTAPIGSVRGIRSNQSLVVLTYDDGPQPGSTEGVLDALREAGATATFFVLLPRVRAYRSLMAEVVAAGHEVALHGVDHVRLTTLSGKEVWRRMRDGRAELEDALDSPVRWFRPPYGAQSPSTLASIRGNGMQSVVWSHTAYDWCDDPVDELADRAVAGLDHGSVLLLHDGYAGPADGADDGPEPTFDRRELSSRILAVMADRGLHGSSLADALTDGKIRRGAWFRS